MTFAAVATTLYALARLAAAGAFALSLLVAGTHWAVRRGRLSAFGGWARFVRGWSDPLLHPVERRLLKSGGNPQDAAWWLVGVAVVGGLLLIFTVNWLLGFVAGMVYRAQVGGSLLTAELIHDLFALLMAAIFIRVVASWFGVGRYTRWMRPVYALTDWLVEPLQKVIPPIGMIDISPLVAYFVLYFAERLVMSAFFG